MDCIPTLKRPMPTDDEEELFRMQDEFFMNKEQPSVKVINLRGSTKPFNTITSDETAKSQTNSGKVRSRFAELKKLKTQNKVCTAQTSGNLINPVIKKNVQENLKPRLQDSIQNIPIISSNMILRNIIEHKHDPHNYKFNQNKFCALGKGFPEVFVSTHMKNDSKQSLFWQQVAPKKHVVHKEESTQNCESLLCQEGSVIAEGLWATEIHQENLERLNEMSLEDILKEKNKLETTLNPELIQFLKERRSRKQKEKENPNTIKKCNAVNNNQNDTSKHNEKLSKDDVTPMQVDKFEQFSNRHNEEMPKDNDTQMQIDESDKTVTEPSIELMKQAKEKGWVHMDSLEIEKFKWMEDIPTQKLDQLIPEEPYNARFDFNGLLLPYKDESVPVEKGLHHHGEEPERPGYSLQELLQLSRSAAQQQRCTALTTLANIMDKSRKGWYDKALQPAPLTALSQRNILLLLRFSLDDTSVAVVTATLQALRAFLYSEADEICLDRLYGFQNYKEPVITSPKTDVTDTSNLKDHELAQLDAIAALLRTDILLRIRYILNEMRPPPVGVTCALEILIRLLRHSTITALNIMSIPNLLETIIENFMPLSTDSLALPENINNVYGVPVIAAVKFYRVLLYYGGKSIAQKLIRLKIVQRIISYACCDAGTGNLNLSIESLRLWKTLLLHREAMDSLTGAQLILLSQLQILLSNHDIQNASELSCEYAAALIAVASCLPFLKPNISILLLKWSTQLLTLTNVTWGNTKLIAETLLAVNDMIIVKKLMISQSEVFSKLPSSSNLLSDCKPATEREPLSLPHLGVLTQDGQLQPIVSQQSCIPFLATVLKVYVSHYFTNEIRAILSLPQLCKYLKQLEMADWCLENSWYTRFEFSFLTAIVNAASLIKDTLDRRTAHVIWKIAIKLVSSLPADCLSDIKNMLRIAISDERLSLGVVANELEKLNLNSNVEDIRLNLTRNVTSLYEQYVVLNGEWNQAAMPKDWLYLPIVYIYTKCRESSGCNDEDESTILTVLSLELVLPDLVEKLSQSLRFSRLVLVYLCDTVYLNSDVSPLLTRAISSLLKSNYKKLNFTIDLPGLNSFTDLFTAMCEHFCSTSYGDYGFSITILAPIAQRHDVHYRKLLWSEHAGLLRYIRLPSERLVIPLKEYLYPLEEDTSLIESYITALVREIVRENWCPIPYAIAVHHSAMYLKQSSKLALRMRTKLGKISNKELVALLLYYEPPTL
ncbi:RNA polymerase II-associated protein 1 isoform X1 [Hylaeus volcanicus]|uniref:RNA polymerase II-associated protein 1 isoform X1 n=1 Tax=Hylaeus volcanicus TaxID=313075 RepID=UPI0023B7A542|nr:RNA polymerase II-associated protein 1 isoform X1 [Hylaeus volcanicus]XP_053990066.1 RNA polymerase II-associated protein 1 isoform X1 [Hylaeus volcanicus]XP_053990068.1 RNA polymerase II-associated protein 1 isoform X1 [Hylaeus volcanicus]